MAEIWYLLNGITFTTRNLHTWVKGEKAPDTEFMFKFTNPKIREDPLGCVLVIGYVLRLRCGNLPARNRPSRKANKYLKLPNAFNFPFQLTLGPVIKAISAGNTVVIKPSKVTSRSAALLQIFTGSANVGRIVSKAVAPHLTPVILELGGTNSHRINEGKKAEVFERSLTVTHRRCHQWSCGRDRQHAIAVV